MKSKRLAHLFLSVGVILLTTIAPFLSAPATTSAATGTLLGIYYGNQGWAISDVKNMEAWQGKKYAVLNMFTDWCNQTKEMDNLFNLQLNYIWNNKNVPMITWQLYLSGTTPNDVEVQAAAGTYDAYLNTWSSRLKTWVSGPDGVYGTSDDRRAYIRLGHEMNGNWYPWSAAVGGNSPNDYINMWRHVRTIFNGKGLDATRVQWVWNVNTTDVGGFTAEQYYPGDAYVDWVGIDGYNWGASQTWSTWQTPAQVFDNMLARLRALTTKPLLIGETASTTSTTSGVSLPAKSQWITDLASYVVTNNIKLLAWFNTDKETDWAVFGGANGDCTYTVGHTTYKCYNSYKSAVSGAGFIPSDPSNLRLLTDAQFAGQ